MKIRRAGGDDDGSRYSPPPPASRRGHVKSRVKYVRLECGHYTDWDEIEENDAFRVLETSLGPLYHACSACFAKGLDPWQKRMKVKKVKLPDDPLF